MSADTGIQIPAVQYVRTPDGTDIAYTISGEGRPFVFLPTFLNHTEGIWRGHTSHIFHALAERFKVVNFDSRGMGLSTRGLLETVTLDDYLCDLETVANYLGLERFVLLGSCQSTFLAAHFAARYPQRVFALVLVNGAMGWNDWRLSSVYDRLPEEDWDLFLYNMCPQTWTPEQTGSAVARLRQSMTQQDYLISARVWQSAGLGSLLGRLHTPTLVLHSRDFRLRSVEAPIDLARRLPNAKLVLMESNLLFGEPGQAMVAIDAFLDELDPEAGKPVAFAEVDATVRHLTTREVEVLRLLAGGESNRAIADSLCLSLRTVERHITNIYAKIGARGRADATAFALRNIRI